MNITAIREQFNHMGRYSGYDALYCKLEKQNAVRSIFCRFDKIYPRGIGRLMLTAAKYVRGSSFYNAQSFEAEIRLAVSAFRYDADVLHYTYSESYLAVAPALQKFINIPIIGTIHQPIAWWQNNPAFYRKFRCLDRVIALSVSDRDHFNEHLKDKAVYIPHGVDTNHYKPRAGNVEKSSGPFRVIFAGKYLRDLDSLSAVIKIVSESSKDIYFDIVLPMNGCEISHELYDIVSLPTVSWYNGVSDDVLLSLYQRAHCSFIPLLASSANNAVLESLSCGLPVISTDLPAVSSYLNSETSILCKQGDIVGYFDAIMILFLNDGLRNAMGQRAREFAEVNFDWKIIARDTQILFQSFK